MQQALRRCTNSIRRSDPGFGAFSNALAKMCRLHGDLAGFSAWVKRVAVDNRG